MLWGGRFSGQANEDLRVLNDSLDFDRRMYAQDIAGSVAYARAIAAAGVITADEADQIIQGLNQVKAEMESGVFVFAPGDEDIHTAVERRLSEITGAVGGKLHTGRSRNDQVATDFRLWVMAAITDLSTQIAALQTVLIDRAEGQIEAVMPGYTHMQPAQPITAAHWLMSFFWMLARDQERLDDALRRTAVMPLGSGALAGTPFPIARDSLAVALNFTSYSHNSLDAVSDRDFAAESLFALSLIGIHLSRLAEDVILYSNPSFGYLSLSDRYSTGSSLMPQKRNADPMELARGKAGRLIGYLTALLTTLKGLPSGYNKDLQEDKEGVFAAFDTLRGLIPVITGVIETLTFRPERMAAALSDDMLATDLADYLVHKGMPFRQAHHAVGQVVRLAVEKNCRLADLHPDDMRQISDLFTDDVHTVFDFKASVARRSTPGGTAPAAVRDQITAARAWLSARKE